MVLQNSKETSARIPKHFPTVLAIFLVGCAADRQESNPFFSDATQAQQSPGGEDNISYWDGDRIAGRPSIKIDLENQRAYFYKNGMLVGISQLSTGREGLKTPTGTFSIIQKDINHVSTKYGDFVDDAGNVVKPNVAVSDPKPPGTHFKGAPMPFFMRIVDGVGMHAGYLPGYPASHGCIRMPEFMAQAFFKSVSTGTPVSIVN